MRIYAVILHSFGHSCSVIDSLKHLQLKDTVFICFCRELFSNRIETIAEDAFQGIEALEFL